MSAGRTVKDRIGFETALQVACLSLIAAVALLGAYMAFVGTTGTMVTEDGEEVTTRSSHPAGFVSGTLAALTFALGLYRFVYVWPTHLALVLAGGMFFFSTGFFVLVPILLATVLLLVVEVRTRALREALAA